MKRTDDLFVLSEQNLGVFFVVGKKFIYIYKYVNVDIHKL